MLRTPAGMGQGAERRANHALGMGQGWGRVPFKAEGFVFVRCLLLPDGPPFLSPDALLSQGGSVGPASIHSLQRRAGRFRVELAPLPRRAWCVHLAHLLRCCLPGTTALFQPIRFFFFPGKLRNVCSQTELRGKMSSIPGREVRES